MVQYACYNYLYIIFFCDFAYPIMAFLNFL